VKKSPSAGKGAKAHITIRGITKLLGRAIESKRPAIRIKSYALEGNCYKGNILGCDWRICKKAHTTRRSRKGI